MISTQLKLQCSNHSKLVSYSINVLPSEALRLAMSHDGLYAIKWMHEWSIPGYL